MRVEKIRKLVEDSSLVVILCHHNADPDAVCAAYALSGLIRRFNPGVEVELAAAEGVSRVSAVVLENLSIKFVEYPRIEDADVIFLVDTNNVMLLENWAERVLRAKVPIIVIDHHAKHPETERIAYMYVVEEASSTCEIIYELFSEAGFKPDLKEATALMLGIAYDTRNFYFASSKTFKIAADLVEIGVRVENAFNLLFTPMDYSERVARLKACQRLSLFKFGEWLIAFSHVSAYQASAARALLSLGAHVAVVVGEREGSLRVSLRSCREFYESTGVHLGKDVAEPLGRMLNGMGGGHASSAGVNAYGSIEKAFDSCIKILEEKLKCHAQPL